MASPVICFRSADSVNGSLQITDFFPNRSQVNPVIDPAAQGPRYIRQVESALPVVANNAVSVAVSGLAAYLLVTVDRAAGNANPSPAEAVAMADALIARMRTGAAMQLANINTVLDGEVAGTGIVGTGNSTATVANILAILGGARVTVPAGTSVNAAFVAAGDQAALFDSGIYSPINEDDSSFWITVEQGQLSRAIAAGIVVSYDGSGAVL